MMSDFSIQPAQTSDISGCYPLNRQLGYETTESAFAERFQFLMKHSDHALFVAKNNLGEVIGWMHLCLRHILQDDHFAQLAAMVVREQERSAGVGAKFLAVAEDWARSQGMNEVLLYSSTPRERAHQFYLKNGYHHRKTQKSFMKTV